MIERLTQVLAHSHEDDTDLGFATIDSVFDSDNDNDEWAQDNRLLYRILETLIIELTASLEQPHEKRVSFTDLRH